MAAGRLDYDDKMVVKNEKEEKRLLGFLQSAENQMEAYMQQRYSKELLLLDRVASRQLKIEQESFKRKDESNKRIKKYEEDLEKLKGKTSKKDIDAQNKLNDLIKKERDLQVEINKHLEERAKKNEEAVKKLAEIEERRAQQNDYSGAVSSSGAALFNGKLSLRDRFEQMQMLSLDKGAGAVVDAVVSGLSNWVNKLDDTINKIADYQSKIDTRLLGTDYTYEGAKGLARTLTSAVGMSPYVKTSKVMENLNVLVEKGIAYNVEQRAFLETISENIATTFSTFDGALLQIIRVQQSDTTAARLGMEASLNSYLNKMYQNTEYLQGISDSVTGNLYEATAQMSATSGVAFEYQVQKWLGSLYSAGMSQGAITSISQALGYLGSGNVTALNSNSALQNLLVMSANKAGLNYASLLTQGLTESSTNELLNAMVEYLAEIADSDNKIVKSQLGSVFGMSMSDLKAVLNIYGDKGDIYSSSLSYNGALQTLYDTANSMGSRISHGALMSNAMDNIKYGVASNIATSPVAYAIWSIANMLSDTVGGIAIPTVSYLGTSVDLETTVADLMKVGTFGYGLLGSIGGLIEASNGGGFNAELMLKSLGVGSSNTVTRGSGLGLTQSGSQISNSMYVGNSSGSDIYNSTMSGVTDTQNQLIEAKQQEAEGEISLADIHIDVTKICTLLEHVVDGTAPFSVKFNDFGMYNPWNVKTGGEE